MNNRQPSAEWAGGTPFDVNKAYLAAQAGDLLAAEQVTDTLEQRCILLAAKCRGVKLDSRLLLPNLKQVGERLLQPADPTEYFPYTDQRYKPSLAVLDVATRYLSGLKRPSDKTVKGAAVALEAVTTIPELALSAGAHLAERNFNFGAADVLRGTAGLLSGIGTLAMDAAERDFMKLVGSTSKFVSSRFDQDFHNPAHLTPWLLASLLAVMSDTKDAPEDLLYDTAVRYMQSYKLSHPPLPLYVLADNLRQRGPIHLTVSRAVAAFRQQVRLGKAAERRRLAKYL